MSELIPIEQIHVPEDRQRKFFDEQELADLKASILTEKGLLCPIFVRPNPEANGDTNGCKYTLVAGERRLKALSTIDVPYMHGDTQVPPGHAPAIVRSFTSMIEVMEAELHENIIRAALTWQEKCDAIAALHELKTAQNPKHTKGMTANLIDKTAKAETGGYSGATKDNVNMALLVKEHLNDPEVAKAASLRDAAKVVTRKLEAATLKQLHGYKAKLAASAAAAAAAAPEATGVPDAAAAGRSSPASGGQASGSAASAAGPAAGPAPGSALGLDTLNTLKLRAAPHKLLTGDMREKIKEIPSGSVHVVVTDPPYGMGVEHFGDSGRSALRHEYSEADFVELHEALVEELSRICAPSAHVYIFCDPYVRVPRYDDRAQLIEGEEEVWWGRLVDLFPSEWRVRRRPLIWNKGTTGNLADGTGQGYKSSHEHILYASRGGRPCSAVIPDVLTFPMERVKVHGAQKPVKLYEKLLEMSSVPGDTVLDAFAGSGTIFRAASQMMVTAIGIELSEQFIPFCQEAMEGKELTEDDVPF